jgi:Flp pilus assembly protein TadD
MGQELTIDQAFALAVQHHQQGNVEEAERIYNAIITAEPNHFQTFGNLGVLARQQGDLSSAKKHLLKALDISPNFTDARFNLGVVYQETGDYENAKACYEISLKDRPDSANILYNLGNLNKEQGEFNKAISYYQKAIKLEPDYAVAHFNLGMTLLLTSDFKDGFAEYEWRNRQPEIIDYHKTLPISSPEWQGEYPSTNRLLIVAEQGLGDTIQFARYVYFMADKYPGQIVFLTHKKLRHLFSDTNFEIITEGQPIPDHDYHVFLMSLPGFVHGMTNKLLEQTNYITSNSAISAKWGDQLAHLQGPKVGIHWQGSPLFNNDRLRSVPLTLFEPLFTQTGINFISLQRGLGSDQISTVPFKNKLYDGLSRIDPADEENAFEETIGVLQNLDLVVTTCTALAHLSSTLGVKTWVILPISPDWRWFLDRDTSPWYENTKLYRQTTFNDWGCVIASLNEDLTAEFTL